MESQISGCAPGGQIIRQKYMSNSPKMGEAVIAYKLFCTICVHMTGADGTNASFQYILLASKLADG